MANEFTDWFQSIPTLTKYWFTGCIIFPLLARINILRAELLLLSPFDVMFRFQIWRPITAALFYPMNFNYLILIYFLYSYSKRLEEGVFDGRPADYLFLLLFNWLCLVIIGLFSFLRSLFTSMILSVVYIWCHINYDEVVDFYFGTRFKAAYLPWMLTLFNLVTKNSFVAEILGILVGHLYFFLMFKYPQDFGGASLISTPRFLYKWFPNRYGATSVHGEAPSSRRDRDAEPHAQHNWGRGNVLGGD